MRGVKRKGKKKKKIENGSRMIFGVTKIKKIDESSKISG